MGIEAWNDLAEAVVGCAGDGDIAAFEAVLIDVGLTDSDRRALTAGTHGRADPAGVLLVRLVHGAGPSVLPPVGHGRPVAEIIARARRPDDAYDLDLSAAALAEVGHDTLLRGLAEELRRGAEPRLVARLLEVMVDRLRGDRRVADRDLSIGDDPVTRTWIPFDRPRQREFSQPPPSAPFSPPPAGPPQAPADPGMRPTSPPPDGPVPRVAYPHIDVTTGTTRNDVVVVDRPFSATIGLGPRPTIHTISTGRISASDEVEMVLMYDPGALALDGPNRHTLTITDEQPYPVVHLTFTALYVEGDPPGRRIGVQYLSGGRIVGVAYRTLTAVREPWQVDDAPDPPAPDDALLDLTPLLEERPPDLILAVCSADATDTGWIWTAYSADPALTVPDRPAVAALGADIAQFALETRRAIQFAARADAAESAIAGYDDLAGRAKRIGLAVPPLIRQTLTALVERPGRARAPSVLLLTEELHVPWELSAFPEPLQSSPGGDAPWLGAHVAISRWPLTSATPRPTPRPTVSVRSCAVVSADYTGIRGWSALPFAQREATAVGARFTPPAGAIGATRAAVRNLLRGQPPADVIHIALHGRFDNQGNDEGIVLIAKDDSGAVRPDLFTPVQAENGNLAAGPFVFLNACQVGADERVLGSYGGFASTLLRIGAAGVVAPLWNVLDEAALAIAEQFYDAAWSGGQRVSVAEAMRIIRAGYTEASVTTGGGATPSSIAFQVFGHPHLMLTPG